MVKEALVGTPIDTEDLPPDIQALTDSPRPKFDLLVPSALPFHSCAFVVNLIASFDRKGEPLPTHLAAIPSSDLDILRSNILEPAKSPLLPALVAALWKLPNARTQKRLRGLANAL
ncbi:hypothetical protein LTR15_006922 [Elasticomyces elasticus]|nr:hypothetical protein LTR15_006922 [Elasticomyces elasticus]